MSDLSKINSPSLAQSRSHSRPWIIFYWMVKWLKKGKLMWKWALDSKRPKRTNPRNILLKMSRFKQWALVSLCMHACAGVGGGAGRLFLCKQLVERLWQCVPHCGLSSTNSVYSGFIGSHLYFLVFSLLELT